MQHCKTLVIYSVPATPSSKQMSTKTAKETTKCQPRMLKKQKSSLDQIPLLSYVCLLKNAHFIPYSNHLPPTPPVEELRCTKFSTAIQVYLDMKLKASRTLRHIPTFETLQLLQPFTTLQWKICCAQDQLRSAALAQFSECFSVPITCATLQLSSTTSAFLEHVRPRNQAPLETFLR